jgi:hypothetical protein
MAGDSGKISIYGSCDMVNYLADKDTVEIITREEMAHKPHAFFIHAGMLHGIGDPKLEQDPNSGRSLLTEHKKIRGTNENYVILFDYAPEGPCFNETTAPRFIALHALLNELGIPSSKVFFLQHNRLLIGEHSAYIWWCRRHGLTPMRMRYAQWWILGQAQSLHRRFADPKIFNAHMDRLRRAWAPENLRKTHKYLCFNYFPRFQRVVTLAWLLEQDLMTQGLVSFPGFRIPESPGIDFMYDTLVNLESWRMGARLKPYLTKLAEISPLRVDSTAKDGKNSLSHQFVDEPYLKTAFSVVTETDFSNGYLTRRITEKFLKAAVHMHPFILLGEPFSLDEIRNFGFETFAPFFDESYDRVRDPEARFEKIGALVRDKCSQSMESVIADARRIMPVLEKNADYAAHGFWDHMRQESEFAVLRELREALRFPDRIPQDLIPTATATKFAPPVPNADDLRLPQDLTEVISHGVHFSFTPEHADGRDYLPLRESDTSGNHCVLLRTMSGGENATAPFSLNFAAQARNIRRMMLDIKGPDRHYFRATFDFKLGIFLESSNIDGKSVIESAIDYEGDEWFRFSFRGPLAHESGALDVIFYLGDLDFVYKGRADSELRLADLSLRYRKAAGKTAQSGATRITAGKLHYGIFDGQGRNIKIRVQSTLMRWPFLYRMARRSYRKFYILRARLRV